MIEYIRGKIAELTPTYAVIETGGIGYMVCITPTPVNNGGGLGGKKRLLPRAKPEAAPARLGLIR
ncbi:MAG: hypothetical protein K2I26_05535, partial [Paramuribaculum sp.]|nr:hypothetical protein [Paramuribaculum sp.]